MTIDRQQQPQNWTAGQTKTILNWQLKYKHDGRHDKPPLLLLEYWKRLVFYRPLLTYRNCCLLSGAFINDEIRYFRPLFAERKATAAIRLVLLRTQFIIRHCSAIRIGLFV